MILKKLLPIKKRTPVRIEILSSAENTSLLHSDLNHILLDESSCCELYGLCRQRWEYTSEDRMYNREEEKRYTWDQLRLKLPPDCYLSVEPTEMLIEPVLVS